MSNFDIVRAMIPDPDAECHVCIDAPPHTGTAHLFDDDIERAREALAALDRISSRLEELEDERTDSLGKWAQVREYEAELARLRRIEEAVVAFRDGHGGPTLWGRVLAALEGGEP